LGKKKTNDIYKDDISIVIFVREKKKEEALSPDQMIPKSFEGYLIDVCVTEMCLPNICENENEYEIIQGGIQIVNKVSFPQGKGTLGCIVRRIQDRSRENVHLLSCKHVLYAGGAAAGDSIYHPNPSKTTLGPIASGAFYGNTPYTPPGIPPGNFFIDCATARIDIDCKTLGTTCTKDDIAYSESIIDLGLNGVNTIRDVRSIINDISICGQSVFKVGRTSGKTKGIVRCVNTPIGFLNDFNNIHSGFSIASNAIQIEFDSTSTPTGLNCMNHPFFTEPGDSGSLVLDDQNNAIGIVHGSPVPGGSTGLSIVCHILPILENLGVCIPTSGGTSRCSCAAADGTGLAPPPAAGAGAGGGAIGIIGGSLASKKINDPAGFLQPEPLTEAQQERLTGLLQAFRSTARGRALHEAFRHIRREIGYLVRNVRPVTVAWHRNKGPAFFACFLNHLRGDAPDFPHEIKEVRLSTLLDKMEMELTHYGSKPLQETIQYYGNDLKRMLLDWNDVHEFLDYLDKNEMQ